MSLTPEQVYCDIVGELQYTCPDAPIDIIERSLISSMRYLAKETCAMQTLLEPPVQDCVADYDLSSLLSDSYEIVKILDVIWQGCCIRHIKKCTMCPCGYELKGRNCLVIHPTPQRPDPGDLKVHVALRPCQDLAEVPDELMQHDQLLKDMTLRNLLSTPKQDYTDIRLALNMDRKIQGAIMDAMCDVQQNYNNEEVRAGEAII